MESTIAEDFLNDLAELSSDEDALSKKPKLFEPDSLERSEILKDPHLDHLINTIDQGKSDMTSEFLQDCNSVLQKIDAE